MTISDSDIVALTEMPASSVFRVPTGDEAAKMFRDAKPFPHLIIDDFLADNVAAKIREVVDDNPSEFPVTFTDTIQTRKSISMGGDVPTYLRALAGKFADPYMLRFFENLTGMRSLIPDPYYNTEYGYYHVVGQGGVLGSHVDHSHHQSMMIPHVLNVVLYMTPDWDEADGGTLHLFNETGKESGEQIACKFNRVAIFICNPIAYHGVEPTREDAERQRHSLYFAYYLVKPDVAVRTAVPPGLHSGTPDQPDFGLQHGTHFVLPWKELFKSANRPHLKNRINEVLSLILPPVIPLMWRKMRHRK